MLSAFKYASPLLVYALAYLSFTYTGVYIFLPLIYAWMLMPLAELFIKPDPSNLEAAEEELAKRNPLYDYLLYLMVVAQFGALFYFLNVMQHVETLHWWEITGRVLTMGLLCGTFGINIGHELGHRNNVFEKFLAKCALLSSLYMHFYIEHNRGHHKRVATHEDPASARFNENIYAFYLRSIFYSYISAWKISFKEMKKRDLEKFSLQNEMVVFHFIQAAFVVMIYFLFGWIPMLCFLAAAIHGIGLLETVNYIEHYGLERKKIDEGKYERAMPHHSWNSNHTLGRVMLFELSRHSDHHYLASRKYQLLKHHEDSPQLPTGYPGSMILSLIPPLWFRVMNKRIVGHIL